MTQQIPAGPVSAAPRSIHNPSGNKPKEYETIYILRSDVDADTADRVQARVAEVVERAKGKLVKVEAWGRRKLAYPVKKQRRGVYVYVKFVGAGGLVQELERNLKLQDAVLKFQTVTLRDQVDLAALTVDPEEVKFARLELAPEAEQEESREKVLGLVEAPDAPRPRHEDDEYADDDMLPPESTSTAEADKTEKTEKTEKKEEEGS